MANLAPLIGPMVNTQEVLGNHPVTGISWFEARAFANYSNMSLPNVYQWLYASGVSSFRSQYRCSK